MDVEEVTKILKTYISHKYTLVGYGVANDAKYLNVPIHDMHKQGEPTLRKVLFKKLGMRIQNKSSKHVAIEDALATGYLASTQYVGCGEYNYTCTVDEFAKTIESAELDNYLMRNRLMKTTNDQCCAFDTICAIANINECEYRYMRKIFVRKHPNGITLESAKTLAQQLKHFPESNVIIHDNHMTWEIYGRSTFKK